ncbi:MAG: VWA domain-containing protein [Pseudomonadota bacterium]
MLPKRREQGFNLSFLDVMACGLGAVILILILVKFQDNTDIPVDELERLKQELAALQDQKSELEQSLSVEQQNTSAKTATLDEIKQRINELKIQQQSTTSALKDQITVIADLENAIAAIAPETADDPIQTPGTQEEDYLLGLKVEGRRIGILIDSSASMTDEALIGVISRKLGSDSEKQAGDKWLRTLRIANWMIARLPQNAEFSVVSFSNKATVHGNSPINRASSSGDLQAVMEELQVVVPANGTNLLNGLREINRALPNMTDLYVVTDGLPTLLDANAGFRTSRRCNPIEGQQSTITGQCRVSVFAHSMRANPINGVKSNVILLPLEGDPEAPSAFWGWANQTRGTFLAPAGSWP